MADEELVAELAEHLRQRFSYEIPTPRDIAEAVVAWLPERGRLVPDGAQVEEQWGVRLIRSTDGTTEDRSFGQHRDGAERYIVQAIAANEATPIARRAWVWQPSLVHRQVITGPWVAVDEETTDG